MLRRLLAWIGWRLAEPGCCTTANGALEKAPRPGTLEDFKTRDPLSVPGAYYVTEQCTDCDCCRVTAPMIFARSEEAGYSYVKKQPSSQAEVELAEKAVTGCPHEAVQRNGREFDWAAVPARPWRLSPEGLAWIEKRSRGTK